jgi:hypothetical protein
MEQNIERLEGFLLQLKNNFNNTITFIENGEGCNVNPHILIGAAVHVLKDAVERIDTIKKD